MKKLVKFDMRSARKEEVEPVTLCHTIIGIGVTVVLQRQSLIEEAHTSTTPTELIIHSAEALEARTVPFKNQETAPWPITLAPCLTLISLKLCKLLYRADSDAAPARPLARTLLASKRLQFNLFPSH